MKFSDWLDEVLEDKGYNVKKIPNKLWDKITSLSDEMEEQIVQDNQNEIVQEILNAYGSELKHFANSREEVQ